MVKTLNGAGWGLFARVAKHGKSFEERLLGSEEGKSAKFNFMKPSDPYNAYYEYKIRQNEEEVRPTANAYRQATADSSIATMTQPPEKKARKEEPAAPAAAPSAPAPAAATAVVTGSAVASSATSTATTTVKKATMMGPIARACECRVQPWGQSPWFCVLMRLVPSCQR
jgi:hypothetical protein